MWLLVFGMELWGRNVAGTISKPFTTRSASAGGNSVIGLGLSVGSQWVASGKPVDVGPAEARFFRQMTAGNPRMTTWAKPSQSEVWDYSVRRDHLGACLRQLWAVCAWMMLRCSFPPPSSPNLQPPCLLRPRSKVRVSNSIRVANETRPLALPYTRPNAHSDGVDQPGAWRDGQE